MGMKEIKCLSLSRFSSLPTSIRINVLIIVHEWKIINVKTNTY